MKLYETIEELTYFESELERYAIEHEGDITDFPFDVHMEQLKRNLDENLLGLGCLTKNLDAEAEAIKTEEKNLAKRRKAIENRSEKIKEMLADNLEEGKKLSDSRCVLSWIKSTSVEVTVDPKFLPAEFQRIKYEADKTKIKDYLKTGQEVDYAELVEKQNLNIR